MKNLIKIIPKLLVAGSLLAYGCSSGIRDPTNEDIIIHKEHQAEEVYIECTRMGIPSHNHLSIELDDEDYILVTKGLDDRISTIYVPEKVYSNVKTGDKFNKKWAYEKRDYEKELLIEEFNKGYKICKK